MGLCDETRSACFWEEEWRRAIYERALRQVRFEVEPRTYEIFRLLVFEQRAARDVAERLSVHHTQVYNAKHRILKRLGQLAAEYEDA